MHDRRARRVRGLGGPRQRGRARVEAPLDRHGPMALARLGAVLGRRDHGDLRAALGQRFGQARGVAGDAAEAAVAVAAGRVGADESDVRSRHR
jgi:hypothetical protein